MTLWALATETIRLHISVQSCQQWTMNFISIIMLVYTGIIWIFVVGVSTSSTNDLLASCSHNKRDVESFDNA